MIMRMLQLGRLAALLLVVGFAFGAAPASAGCYNDCYAPAPIVVEPQPVYYQSCGTCCGGCGSAYYMSYYPAYTYPSAGYGCGGCGYGGYAGYGTAFRITTNGVFTSLTSFAGINGAEALGNLTLGKDGHFYGTTIRGGAYDLGTVFRLDISSPPTITCLPSATVECGNPVEVQVRVNDLDGDPLTVVWELNGEPVQTNTVPAEGPPTQADVSLLAELPVGTNFITVAVADSAANRASCSTEIRVVDTTPPVMLALTAKPNALWPPDHRMVVVNLSAVVVDGCSATTWKITGVRSSEPVVGRGAGKTSADWTIIDDHTLQLRAERSGLGADRVYTIEVQASDDAGNLSEPRTLTVRVPKRSLHQPHTHHGVGPGEGGNL